MARAGALDQRITLQSYSMASDGAGGQTKTWANLPSTPSVWASVKAGSGGEAFKSDRDTATAQCTFTIRNRTDLDERMRIVWDGVNYNIRAILREGSRAKYLSIVAERGV